MLKMLRRISGLLILFGTVYSCKTYSQTGLDSRVNLHGINFFADVSNDFLRNLSGGNSEASSYIALFQPAVYVDLEKNFGLNGTYVYISAMGSLGDSFNNSVGAEQGVDNIEAGRELKLYEFWIAHSSFDNRLSLKFGLYDLNSEFDTRISSSIFINPSHGIGAEYALSGEGGPSIFPNTSPAFRIKYNSPLGLYAQSAVFFDMQGERLPFSSIKDDQALNKGFLIAAETGYEKDRENNSGPYLKLSLGGWYYTNNFKRLNYLHGKNITAYVRGNFGIYLSSEKTLYAEPSGTGVGLAAFIRVGIADKKVNKVDGYWGAGLNYTGLIPGRENDVFGVAIASAHNCEYYRDSEAAAGNRIERYEYIWEVTYEMNLGNGFKVQPDFQFVKNPADCFKNDYAVVIGTRLQYNLN